MVQLKDAASFRRPESYVNGQWIESQSGAKFEVFNPSNGQLIGEVCDMTEMEVKVAIDAASDAFEHWSKTPAKERCTFLSTWCNLIMQNVEDLAIILSEENGKPLAESKGEITYAASFLEWYAAEGRRNYGETVDFPVNSRRSIIRKEPIGVAGIIIPWNFPSAMLTRKVGPALAVGCTVVVKTPEDTPYSAMALAELAHRAGIPKGVVNVLSASRDNAASIGRIMCEDRRVATMSFTGSCAVGKLLMSQCSAQVKRISLELGGRAPFIVFNSADLSKVEKGVKYSKFSNAGQTCISAQNYYLQEDIYDKALEILVKVTKSMKLGDPLTPGTTVGPLINRRGVKKVERLVEDAKMRGAKAIVGGCKASEVGELYYHPTVLVDVTEDMDIAKEEVFGPVLNVMKFKTEKEVIKRANNSERGLASYFFSSELSQCYRVMEALQTGLVGCNECVTRSCETPFGGYKESGIGREGGHYGLDEFLEVKTVVIGIDPSA